MDDFDLLVEFAQRRSQTAFARLVEIHADWVYSAARRLVRDAHLAEDVTQAVFIALARKAAAIRNRIALSSWLFKAVRFAAIDAVRREASRKKHETEAAMSRLSIAKSDPEWDEFAPMLDEMVAKLSEAHRQAILLRFYQQKPLKEVGTVLGISEDAAKKRVSRAVLQLRDICTRRGITAAGAISAALLESNVTHAAPSTVVHAAAQASMSTGSMAISSSIAHSIQSAMVLAKIKVAALILMAIATAVAAVVLSNSLRRSAIQIAGGKVPATASTQATSAATEAARKAVIARLKTLQSISVDFDVEETFTPDLRNMPKRPAAPAPTGGITFRTRTGTEKSTGRFSFLNGGGRWESKSSPEKIQQDQQNHVIPITAFVQTFSGDIYEQMTERTDGASIRIESRNLPPEAGAIDIGLGLRSGFEGGQGHWWETQGTWLTPASLQQMDLAQVEGKVILSRLNRANQKLEWIFDPNRQHVLIAYHRRDNQPPYVIVDEVTASDFQPVNGVLLPSTIIWRTLNREGFEIRRWQAKLKQYTLNDAANTAARYHIEPAPGVMVTDVRPPSAAAIAAGKIGDQSDRSTPRGTAKALVEAIINGDAVTAKGFFAPADQDEIEALIEQADAWRLLQQAVAAKFGAGSVAALPSSTLAGFQQMLDRVEVYIEGDSARLAMADSPRSSGVQLIKSDGRWKVQQFPGGGPTLTQSAMMTAQIANHLAAETAQGNFRSAKEVADQFNRRIMEKLREKAKPAK